MKSTLYIMGAGPGDPDLISVKGARVLGTANVILYDALVSQDLLALAPPGCKRIFVGKRKGKKEYAQDEINRLLVWYARRFICVIRLKGGDPFVFGRGFEEQQYAADHGVHVEVIPGISSALAAPTLAGIPLTRRGVNESFWVVTGTVSTGELSRDIHQAVQSSATLIVLISHLREIMTIVTEVRGPREPVAIIEQASLAAQKVHLGVASDMFEKTVKTKVITPAVIVIGKVVACYENLNFSEAFQMIGDEQQDLIQEVR
jgi:uroporphyrin-III C-methyltransferase